MAITVCPLTCEEDALGKARVHCAAWKEAYRGLLDQSFLDARTLAFSEERALWAYRADIQTLLAKDDGSVVGFADYGPYRGDDLDCAGEVYALYLLRAYYRRGIGTRLMREACARMSHYDTIVVWVLEGNDRAIAFYQQCGFAFDGGRQTLTLGSEVHDLRMVLHR